MQAELLILRIVHVLGAIAWLGGSSFTAWYLMPAIRQAGAGGGQVLTILVRRKVFMMFPIIAALTMLAGIRLMMITSNGFSRDYFARPGGKTYAVAAIMSIVAFLLGIVVARPAATRMGKLSQMSSSDDFSREKIAAEIQALQRRATIASTLGLALLWLAAVGMAIARYL